MQKRIITLSVTALVAVLFFSSCSKKTNKQGRYIPETAAAVMHINGESLNAKLSWDEIKENEWFKEMQKDSSITAFQKTILEKPENSGVNVKSDLLIFYVSDSTASYAAIEGAIADEAKFKSMLQESNKNGKETVKDGYTYFADEKNCVAYNKERFFATMHTGDYNYMTNPLPLPADTGYAGDAPAKKSDMSAVAAQLIALAEGKSLAKNEKFSELLATKGDAHFWLNAQYLNTAKSLGGMAAMANLSKLYDGNITAGTLSFENGKIDMDIKSFAGKELTDLYKKYSGSSIDKTMLQNIPSQNVAGVFALNFKPEGIKELLKILNMDGLANLGAGQIGFNLDDFIKANKGDILFAATDVKQDSTGFGTDAKFIFAASIGDKAAFGKLIDAGKKVGGPMLGSSSGTEKFSFNTNEKYFVFTNDKTNTDQFLAGSTAAAPSYIDKIVGGPFGGFVNFQYLLTSMKPRATADSIDKATYDATIKMWDNMVMNGGNYKDGGLTQHWEINLLDKNTNSLKQLNAYLGKVGMLQKKKTDMQTASWKDEDVMFDAPTTTTVETVPAPADTRK